MHPGEVKSIRNTYIKHIFLDRFVIFCDCFLTVLSMLSAIQNVKLPNTSSGSSHPVETKTDMSRRKQRNPKPIFNSTEDDDQQEPSQEESQRMGGKSDEDNDSIHEDLHTMVKVEVHEQKTPPASVPPPLMPATPTPPPSTSSGVRLPPLQLRSNPEQMMLNHTAELLAKQNMFFFGDVTVAEHPDAPPVPMVIPMAYLYPLPSTHKENVKYRMFVPLGGGLGPELLAPSPGAGPPIPTPANIMSPLPKLEKVPTRPESRDSSGEREISRRKSGETTSTTTPLDLSKSPEVDRSINSDSEQEAILPDQRALPPLRRVSIVKEDELKSPPSAASSSAPPAAAAANPHIEAQLQFLKAKQLEFLKGKIFKIPSIFEV